jgi:hypothetical protein
VKDRGGQPWTLDPSKVRFISDEGREQAGAQAWSGKETLKTVTVLPGGEATFELVMPLPPDTRFRILGSFRLIWPYEYGGKAYETSTKFLKIEEVNYYYPGYSYPYYYPYGPYWEGEWGWDYGPWWGGEEGPEEEFEEHENR